MSALSVIDHSRDIARYISGFLVDQYLNTAGINTGWCIAYGDLPRVTRVVDASTGTAQFIFHLRVLRLEGDAGISTTIAQRSCDTAASLGMVHLLRAAHESGLGMMTKATCAAAARKGHLTTLEYLRLGAWCPWDSSTVHMAAIGGHMAVVKWCFEHQCPSDHATLLYAAGTLNEEMVIFLLENGHTMNSSVLTAAAWAGDGAIKIVNLALSMGLKFPKLFSDAIDAGNLSLLKKLDDIDYPFNYSRVMLSAHREGVRSDIVSWLVSRRQQNMSAPKALKTQPVSSVEALGIEFLAVEVFPMVGERDYLHVAPVSSTFGHAYVGYTRGSTFTEGLTKFSTRKQVKEKLRCGYSSIKLLKEACSLGSIGIIRKLYPRVLKLYRGIFHRRRLSAELFTVMAKNGKLSAMKWAIDSHTIPSDCITFDVQRTAIKARQLDVFRYCVEQQNKYAYTDVEDSVAMAVDDEEYMQWANGKFSRLLIARGAAGSDSENALELFKRVDPTDANDPSGQYVHFQRAFEGGNFAVLDYVANKLRVANSEDASTDWVAKACSWVRCVRDMYRSGHRGKWYNERSIDWAIGHPVYSRYLV